MTDAGFNEAYSILAKSEGINLDAIDGPECTICFEKTNSKVTVICANGHVTHEVCMLSWGIEVNAQASNEGDRIDLFCPAGCRDIICGAQYTENFVYTVQRLWLLHPSCLRVAYECIHEPKVRLH
jgi:hypothetical protein